MRHVSRTHSVDLYGVYDRINLEPLDQNKYAFTGDRWTLLVNIMTHDKDSEMDYHAVLPPEYQAGGDFERENMCQKS